MKNKRRKKKIYFSRRDFNLEKKIEALPSLSLEEFQIMKKQQRTKKKQKVGNSTTKRLQREENSLERNGRKESEKSISLVGSQKRKARKNSITRNTLSSADTSNAEQGSKGNFCFVSIFSFFSFFVFQ